MAHSREPGQPKNQRNVNPALAASYHERVAESGADRSDRHETSRYLGEIVTTVSTFDHGYLKVRRETDGFHVHLTFTWTTTRARGHYVYVRVPGSELLEGLTVLARKILEVDDGQRQPTPDKRGPLRA